jgi:spore coat protein U-like protein
LARTAPRRSASHTALALLATASLSGLIPSTEPVSAATQTATVNTQAQINAACTMNVTANLNLPPYDINSGTPFTASGSFDVTCTQDSPIFVTMSQGLNPGPGSTDTNPVRQLSAGGTDRINYGLYLDAAYTIPWGNTFGSGASLNGEAGGDTLQLYVEIPAGQTVMSGVYTDTVTATVTY